MSPSLVFVYLDGREIQGSSAREVIEALRDGELASPDDLGRFLDLVSRRAALTYSIVLDVGDPGAHLEGRCRSALASLIQHGWLRVKKARATWPPQVRRGVPALEREAPAPVA